VAQDCGRDHEGSRYGRFVTTVSRALFVMCVLGCVACDNSSIDAAKFTNVNAAARALKDDLTDSGGNSPQFVELLKQFRLEISALEDRTAGSRENAVLKAYAGASEAYGYFLRFKLLETEAVGEMVLLRGSNRPVASRYQLAMENRGGGRWVNRKDAMKVFRDHAERELTTAANLLAAN
jgi:hypothetical protein